MDYTHGGVIPARWAAGKPLRGLFGLKRSQVRQGKEITVYRCDACGHLESYAFDQP